jgi:hypothetical protein
MRQRLFRVPSMSTAAHCPFGVSCLPRVSALFATSPKHVHKTCCVQQARMRPPYARPSQASLRSVLRLSQPLDGLHRASAGELVSSHRHVQGFKPSRGFSLRAATLPRQKSLAPLSLKLRSLTDRNRLPQTKPRDFEAFLHTKMRSSGLVLPAPSVAPLLGFTLLQAFDLRR